MVARASHDGHVILEGPPVSEAGRGLIRLGFWPWVGMQQRLVQGVQLGMVGTGRCSQWGSEQGWWCKLDQREEEVVEWDLALGTNHDTTHLMRSPMLGGSSNTSIHLSSTNMSIRDCLCPAGSWT